MIFRGNKGVTLVEVLVSVLIVSIFLTVVLVAVSQSVVNTTRVNMVYTASNLAKKRVDVLKRIPFRDLKDCAEETSVRVDPNGEPDAGGEYVRSTEITEDFDSNTYLTKVKVIVDRIEDGVPSGKELEIETLFADVE